MIVAWAVCLLLASASADGITSGSSSTLDLVPAAAQSPEWQEGPRRMVPTSRALFDYMNGGAELYIDYGFQDLAVAEWTSPDGHPLKIEIYRLKQSKSAYGLFSYDTWGEDVDVGQGGRYQNGTLRFWKGEYFGRVFMWRGHENHRDTIIKAGRSVSQRIKSTGDVPALVEVMPKEGQAEGGVHFFHTALALGGLYYLSDGNPLQLSEKTDGMIGEYVADGDYPAYLVIISYPDEAAAEKALWSFHEAEKLEGVLHDGNARGPILTQNDELWRMLKVQRSFLILAADCPSEEMCRDLVGRAEANLDKVRSNRSKASCKKVGTPE